LIPGQGFYFFSILWYQQFGKLFQWLAKLLEFILEKTQNFQSFPNSFVKHNYQICHQ
jgi:hypothetical protein